MTPRQQRIDDLRRKRAFYERLGKRKRLVQIDAELVPLVRDEIAGELLVEQVRRDIEWIGGGTRGRAA